MADLRAEVANFAVVGEKRSTQFLEPGKAWALNHIPLRLSGKNIDIYQRPSAFERRSKLVGKWVPTTTIIVRNVSAPDQKRAERIIQDLCHLLSFATMSQVRPFVFDFGGIARRWTGEGVLSQFRAPIELDGEAIARFVRMTWTRYRLLKRTRGLAELIHYLTLADQPDQPIEVRMLLTFVALENMKGTWARSEGIPSRRGQFMKTTHKNGKAKLVPYKFEELLNLMFEKVKMRPRMRRIVRVRNDIIHFGLTTRSFPANVSYYERSRALQHEYLLRLLHYVGTFLDYHSMRHRTLRQLA